ncbi:MAG: 2-amino-4-hydroxy-6-hydroxymethyldihydropteridine diphosphokinase [Flavobacteriales bacterium]|nr:2-amino-4-hydroxy-6-hydroxymethyldihydropteridine diphosphokinase [Flavobacteriales bacterium]MBP9079808.1 2-amino-4-hydroxy-6-hydroxymethyldihydropteridine diphosphokinase [Flavobacteriales bacterium]
MAEFTLLMGADLGDPAHTFARATALIAARIGKVLATSRDHWTKPWGFQSDRPFLNRALLVESTMDPGQVMDGLLQIEQELGRKRAPSEGYASRLIDLDILFIGAQIRDQPGLRVPHPRVHLRTFALAPAADIVPGLMHPQAGRTVLDLLNHCQQQA